MAKKVKGLSVETQQAIKAAVDAGLKAGIIHAEATAKDAYKATERRLYAYPDLVSKIVDDKERLDEWQTHGAPGRSQSIVRYSKSSVRVDPDEMLEGMIQDLRARIEIDEYEIATLDKALSSISGDSYYLSVKGKYLDNMDDETIAEAIHCDASTVRRNRGRLVRRLAVKLYGAGAV